MTSSDRNEQCKEECPIRELSPDVGHQFFIILTKIKYVSPGQCILYALDLFFRLTKPVRLKNCEAHSTLKPTLLSIYVVILNINCSP